MPSAVTPPLAFMQQPVCYNLICDAVASNQHLCDRCQMVEYCE